MIKLKITSVKKLPSVRKVYDLTVNKNHNFFIGEKQEILTHNCTHILQASQVVLLNMMETYSLNTRFILTGNYPERLIDPLRSRCQEFDLQPPSKKIIAQHIHDILNKEEIEHTLEDIAVIIKKFYPDYRRIINNCQKYTVDNILKLDNSINISNDYKDKILSELKTPTSKSLNNIRQIIADADLNDYEDLYRFLYDSLDQYSKANEGTLIIIIEEYKFHSLSRIDQEICFCACISKLLQNLTKKVI
jgi:DNA polymerase III delta prime subunit